MAEAHRPQRLDALLSRYGYCSRSEARAWLKAGRVTIGGQPARSPSDKAAPASVLVDGAPIEHPDGLLALLHKPAGYVCSHDAAEGRSVYDLLPPRWSQRNPPVTTIGRLDKDTTGVLLITDNGDLVHRWTSPKHKVPKLYEVTVSADLPPGLIALFAAGTLLLDGEKDPCLPAKLEILSLREARVELTEGRYHQVKRMFAGQGCPVIRLHRSRFGDYTVEGLSLGEWRIITSTPTRHMKSLCLPFLVLASALPSFAADRSAEPYREGTQCHSPDGQLSAEYSQREIDVIITDLATRRHRPPISMGETPVLSLFWTNDSENLVTIEHFAGPQSGAVLHHWNGRAWVDTEEAPPQPEDIPKYHVVSVRDGKNGLQLTYSYWKKTPGTDTPSIHYYLCIFTVDPVTGRRSHLRTEEISEARFVRVKTF